MTDITDQDRRQLRDDAKAVINKTAMRSSAAVSIAQYVLATVEPPAPTLAEELRYRATLLDNGDPDGDTPQALRSLATRAEQMEQDAEDRQEWNRRITEQNATLARERDEARAEVERVTTAQDTERPDDNDWLAGMKEATRYAINATRPDPADVPTGEAWLVEVDGERRFGFRCDPSDEDEPWATFVKIPWDTDWESDYRITMVSRLVPAPRVITNPDELDQAKRDTVIRDAAGVVCSRDGMGDAWTTFTSLANQRPHIALPVTVLWEPGE